MSNLWERFEKSGSINDYLNYIACTSEDSMTGKANYDDCIWQTSYVIKNEEGGCIRDSIISNRDGFVSHANWGL